jgi:precorrin-8X/cobalt-precorrin-8 methylmutase
LGYLKNPDEIYKESFAAIRRETDLSRLPEGLRPLAIRLVHSCGMPDLVDDLAWFGDPAAAAAGAIAAGADICVDATMVESGIMTARLPGASLILCTLNDPETPGLAKAAATTRSAAAIDLWGARLDGGLAVIGNAPTALFRLIEILSAGGAARPAAIFAFPVGFVGAAESKQALIDAGLDIPFVTVKGRRGGSAMAAAAVNAVILGGDEGAAS